MWVFLNNAFLSIVADEKGGDPLLVRARKAGDIEAALGGIVPGYNIVVTNTPGSDYAYRAFVTRGVVSAAIAEHIASIDYTNFKNSVGDNERHDVYLQVWAAMSRWQNMPRPRARLVRRRKTLLDRSQESD